MKKAIFICLLCISVLTLSACGGAKTIDQESTIIEKQHLDNKYYLIVEYDLPGFDEPLSATIQVTVNIYNQHQVGDTYYFKRPA